MQKYMYLIGHSHIHWLMAKFIKEGNKNVPNAQKRDLSNFKIDPNDLKNGHFGSRGLKFSRINDPDCDFNLFCESLPRNVTKEIILWLGDNDVMSMSPSKLVDKIMSLAKDLIKRQNCNKVHIMQLLPRYGNTIEYNERAANINAMLAAECENKNEMNFIANVFHFPTTNEAKFLKDQNKFIEDIHLNSLGQRRYTNVLNLWQSSWLMPNKVIQYSIKEELSRCLQSKE